MSDIRSSTSFSILLAVKPESQLKCLPKPFAELDFGPETHLRISKSQVTGVSGRIVLITEQYFSIDSLIARLNLSGLTSPRSLKCR
jgi:hypothetical protein